MEGCRAVRRLFAVFFLLSALAAGGALWWINHGLGASSESVDLSVEPGTSVRGVAQAVNNAGLQVSPTLLYWWFRLSGEARQIKAGSYELDRGVSPRSILRKLVRGEEALYAVTLVEGWKFSQVRAALLKAEQLKPDTQALAAIVEKETGQAADRPMVASVFVNRLRSGMLLQTDPTVIYGLGDGFDGNLRRRDLQTDTPWNTYTRSGLPPTPIAMPGKSALLAAVQPASTKALYFVARGDGTSQFSVTLEEHNQAVNKYQRGQ